MQLETQLFSIITKNKSTSMVRINPSNTILKTFTHLKDCKGHEDIIEKADIYRSELTDSYISMETNIGHSRDIYMWESNYFHPLKTQFNSQ